MTTQQPRRIVVVGATSAIAEHCVRHWLAQGPADVTLCGRNEKRLERVAADLRVRSPQSEVRAQVVDFDDPAKIAAGVDALALPQPPDIVLIAHGLLPDQVRCQEDLLLAEHALRVNAISPALYAEAFVRHMERAGHGTLIVIGSVAGDRGRESNYVYGAAKGLLERYAQGLQHRLAGTRVKVVLAKPGPTETPMTAHMQAPGGGRMARVEHVAARIVAGADQGRPVIYAPAKWWLIMMAIRHLPRAVFNRLNI
jgi:decaprenylphospho-beta-D-erythro-pentofuranosid-2-ulose 2-reductase